MRLGVAILFALLCSSGAAAGDRLNRILNRVSEEAEVFRMLAPQVVGRETLRQKSRKNPGRFRLRVGDDALKPPQPKYKTRELVSEYGFSTVAEAPGALLELRQIVSIDGRQVVDQRKARETLTLGLKNNDDRAKKRMLRRFEKLGLSGAATDFGQVLLLFRRGNLERYEFSIEGVDRLGADEVIVLRFTQRKGPEAFTVFRGRESLHARLSGEIWVRSADFLPLRVDMSTGIDNGKFVTMHRGAVNYFRSAHSVMLPASVTYRQEVDGELLVENIASYSDFQMFSVDAAITFAPATDEDAPQLAEPPPEP